MDFLNRIPRAAQIGIVVVFVLLIGLFAVKTATKGDGMIVVAHSSDRNQVQAWLWKLKQEKMQPTVKMDKDSGELQVRLPSGSEDASSMAIDVDSKIGVDTTSSCKAPGQFGSNAAQDAYDKCINERQIHDALVKLDTILEASVQVSTSDSDSLTGSDTVTRISIVLFVDPDAKTPPDGRALALQVANMADGASPDTVNITTSAGDILWQKGSGTAGASGATGGAVGCDTTTDVADMDITSKERMVKACIEQEILTNISTLVGGAQNARVIVNPTLSPEASSQTVKSITGGAVVTENTQTQSGSGSQSANKRLDKTPNETTTATEKQAGYIDRLAISVFLNSREVSPATENAIRAALTQYVDTRRGDPAPVVRSFQFAQKTAAPKGASTGGAAGAPLNGDSTGATGGTAGGTVETDEVNKAIAKGSAGSVPTWLIVVGSVITLGLVAALLLMWRHSARMAAERKQFESEFRNDARLFEDYSNANPDVLAQQLNDLFAQPAAPTR